MKILLVNLSPLKFNAATPDNEPLGGSESSVCYLSRQMAKRGHDVTLAALMPDGFSGSVHGVKHQPVSVLKDKEFFKAEKFDVIIVCNALIACPALRDISPCSKIVFWNHVLSDQASVKELGNPDVKRSIDRIVYVSEWQQGETEKIFGAQKSSSVIGNGFAPVFENMFASPRDILDAKKNRAAYTTTPFRGLKILLKVMEGLDSDIKLDIYSSMRVYQEKDDDYADLYREAKKDPRIACHDALSQSQLAKKLKPVAFLTYPSTMEESFCISVLEAMAAGMKIITTRTGALESTTMGFAELVPLQTNRAEDLIAAYRAAFDKNIAAFAMCPEAIAENMYDQVRAVNRNCSWQVRAEQWEKILGEEFLKSA